MTTQDQIDSAIRKEGSKLYNILIFKSEVLAGATVAYFNGKDGAYSNMLMKQNEMAEAAKNYAEYMKTNGMV